MMYIKIAIYRQASMNIIKDRCRAAAELEAMVVVVVVVVVGGRPGLG